MKPLPPPSGAEPWQVLKAAGSLIPYVTDGVKRMWAMEVFQSQPDPEKPTVSDRLPDLNLDSVVPVGDSDSSHGPAPTAPTTSAPVAPMAGLTPGPLNPNHYSLVLTGIPFRSSCLVVKTNVPFIDGSHVNEY